MRALVLGAAPRPRRRQQDEHAITFADTAPDVHRWTGQGQALTAAVRAAELIGGRVDLADMAFAKGGPAMDRFKARFEVLDERFGFDGGDDYVEVLHRGSRKTEGPVYFPAGRYLVWSDIPNDRLLRWDETTGAVGVFRSPSGNANGNSVDRQGRLITCEQGTRRVTRTEYDGSITVLADSYRGRRLNSPNDVVVRSDGSIWFTDPRYGITGYYEGSPADSEIGADHVYRLDPETGELTIVADDFVRPNGLAFSPDESQVYIVDTRKRHMRVFEVRDDGTLSGGKVFAEAWFDGIRLDCYGRVWAAALDGLHCYHPDGTLLCKLLLPESASNLTFGGAKRNNLFITNSAGDLYSIRLTFAGIAA